MYISMASFRVLSARNPLAMTLSRPSTADSAHNSPQLGSGS